MKHNKMQHAALACSVWILSLSLLSCQLETGSVNDKDTRARDIRLPSAADADYSLTEEPTPVTPPGGTDLEPSNPNLVTQDDINEPVETACAECDLITRAQCVLDIRTQQEEEDDGSTVTNNLYRICGLNIDAVNESGESVCDDKFVHWDGSGRASAPNSSDIIKIFMGPYSLGDENHPIARFREFDGLANRPIRWRDMLLGRLDSAINECGKLIGHASAFLESRGVNAAAKNLSLTSLESRVEQMQKSMSAQQEQIRGSQTYIYGLRVGSGVLFLWAVKLAYENKGPIPYIYRSIRGVIGNVCSKPEPESEEPESESESEPEAGTAPQPPAPQPPAPPPATPPTTQSQSPSPSPSPSPTDTLGGGTGATGLLLLHTYEDGSKLFGLPPIPGQMEQSPTIIIFGDRLDDVDGPLTGAAGSAFSAGGAQ